MPQCAGSLSISPALKSGGRGAITMSKLTTTMRLVRSETKELTPELAAQFATMPGSVTERDLDKKRVTTLKERVLGGTALSFIWATATVVATGETFRINGNHSSNMLSHLDGAFPTGLKVHLDHYEVAQTRDLALLFRQIDYRGSARSIADISGAYQMLVEELRDVPKDRARKALDGVSWFLRKIVGSAVPRGDDVFDLFNEPIYHGFIHMAGRILSPKTSEFTTPVIGAMYGTYDIAPDEAEEFWYAVAHEGAGQDDKHPTTMLDAWLVANLQAVNPEPQLAVYRACGMAWNAYRAKRSNLSITKYDAKKGVPDLN